MNRRSRRELLKRSLERSAELERIIVEAVEWLAREEPEEALEVLHRAAPEIPEQEP